MSKPLYLNNNDLQSLGDRELLDFDLINPIKKIIGDDLLCVQLDRNLWCVYLTNADSRYKLLIQGVEINNTTYEFYDTKSYAPGAKSVNQKILKLRICRLLLSVADSAVCKMLDKLNVKLTKKITNVKIRDPETKRMTSILNDTIFLFTEPLPDLTIAPVSSAKYFILGNLKKKKRKPAALYKLLENRSHKV